MKNNRWKYLFVVLLGLSFSACEREFIPEESTEEPEIVVEGYIEAGPGTNPTFVTITQTLSFFQELGQDAFEDLYVHDAEVTVSDGTQEWELVEVCWENLPDEIREQVLELVGFSVDTLAFNACVYIDPTFQLEGEVGKTYDLEIKVKEKVLTASTTIPPHVPLDSISTRMLAGDSLADWREIRAFIDDPADRKDFYRYFTAVNSPVLVSPINSVVDDPLFNGQSFEFPIAKAEARDSTGDFETFGLYLVNDTVQIKWTNLDEEHFNFWNTLEFNAVNQGPFSSYTRISGNVEGGLGIWGGSSYSLYDLIIPE